MFGNFPPIGPVRVRVVLGCGGVGQSEEKPTNNMSMGMSMGQKSCLKSQLCLFAQDVIVLLKGLPLFPVFKIVGKKMGFFLLY